VRNKFKRKFTQCRIFRDYRKNRYIDKDRNAIIILGEYHPKHNKSYEVMDNFSKKILLLKKEQISQPQYHFYKEAVNYFSFRLHLMLSCKTRFVICGYPTSQKGYAGRGITQIIKNLCRYSVNRIDGSNVLMRRLTVPKKSQGGERNYEKEIETLCVTRKSLVQNQQVLLIDDITTTGVSLRAGKQVLLRAGAKLVAMLALGKTVYAG